FLSTARVPPDSVLFSLHDALPIWRLRIASRRPGFDGRDLEQGGFDRLPEILGLGARADVEPLDLLAVGADEARLKGLAARRGQRSEEHTSELQSPDPLVCRLLLEK